MQEINETNIPSFGEKHRSGPTVHPVEQAYLHRMVQAVAAYLCEISISEYPKISSSSGRLAESCTEWRQEKRPPRGDQRSGYFFPLSGRVYYGFFAPVAFRGVRVVGLM